MGDGVWGDDIAVVATDDSQAVVARLPDGPVWVLDGIASAVATSLGELGDVERVVDWATTSFAGDPEQVRADVLSFVNDLRARGLLR